MRFLLDSNVFIEAKNRYYAFDICPGFWHWMDSVVGADVGSIQNVRDELSKGEDELATWVNHRRDADWFLKVDDEDTQKVFSKIAEHVTNLDYKEAGVAKFLSGADPWLIAKAAVIGGTLVTHEVLNEFAKKTVPIPNVCKKFGVPFMNTFDALRGLSTSFNWQSPDK
jgi:hypothetical protein